MNSNSSRAARAYALASATDQSWDKIADTLGYKDSRSAKASANHYARTSRQPWPANGSATVGSARSARAYGMRRAGASWRSIADTLGYAHSASCSNSARKFARSNGKPWPVVKAPVQQSVELPTRNDLLALLYSTAKRLDNGTADHSSSLALVQVVDAAMGLIEK